ncbi:MAG: hypothetical protein JW818_05220 [Pirellulales bacterium]|nr:hypothetical protein [Pirellulales bacterium]
MQYRHGDVMIEKVQSLPSRKRKARHTILAHGEITGHSHRIQEQGHASLYETPSGFYLHVTKEPATVVHEEHDPIALGKGYYRIWRQREYSPEEIRVIRD